ncbi:hypothetical protein SCUP234_11897 [Seiridium cupressi]
MADDNAEGVRRMSTAVPIAQLTPDTSHSSAVHGIVTIVWPFNKVNNSVAFILAEPEFRLRRAKGQIRVNFVGSSAKAISECGLGSNDKIQLSLEGAELVVNNAKARIPGAESDWQLNFSERLRLQARLGETGETKHIDVDHPGNHEPAPATPAAPLQDAEVELPPLDLPSLPNLTAATPIKNTPFTALKDGEFESPAFVKRARISYGSLFEDDIFEEDGGVKGGGRKRTRFSLNPGSWRYTSRSPSPEPPAAEAKESARGNGERGSSPSRPEMTDGACQTMELDFPEPASQDNALEQLRGAPQAIQQPNAFLNTGGFIDQGHQTYPLVADGWAAPVSESRPPFSNSDLFGSSQPDAPFNSSIGAGLGGDGGHETWGAQHLPSQPLAYPELPFNEPQDAFAPNIEQPFGLSQTNGFGSGQRTTPANPFAQSGPFSTMGAVEGNTRDTLENRDVSHVHSPQPASAYPDPEKDAAFHPFPPHKVPTGSPFAESGVPLAEETVTVPANPFARETSIPSERAAMIAGTSSWTAVNDRTASRSVSRPASSRLGSGDGQTPQSALVINESDSDEDENEVPMVDAAEANLGDAPVSLPEHAGQALAEAARNPLIEGPPPGHNVTEEDWEEEVHAYANHSPDRYDDEYDEDDEGGDYNTSTYLAPQDDEDDVNDMDLRQQHLEPEFNNGESESGEEGGQFSDEGEFDDDEDEDEDEYEDESEGDADIPPQPQRQATRPASSAPVVIDLLSDSDDDVPPPRPMPSTMPTSRPQSLHTSVLPCSPSYGPGSGEVTEEDEDGDDTDDSREEEELVLHQTERGQAQQHRLSEEDESHDQDDGGIDSGSDAQIFEGSPKSESDDGNNDQVAIAIDRVQVPSAQKLENVDHQISSESRSSLPQHITEDQVKRDSDEDMQDVSNEQSQISTDEGRRDELMKTPLAQDVQCKQADNMETDTLVGAAQGECLQAEVEEPKISLPVLESPPESNLEANMAAPSSPPLTPSLQSQVPGTEEDVAVGETVPVIETSVPDDHLLTPLDTQLRGFQARETTTMEIDIVETTQRQSPQTQSPIITATTNESIQSTIVEADTANAEVVPEQRARSHSPVLEPSLTQGNTLDVSQDPIFSGPASDLTFESQVGGRDPLQAALREVSQPITQVLESSLRQTNDEMSDAGSFVSQMDEDDALQAALRKEYSGWTYVDTGEPARPEDIPDDYSHYVRPTFMEDQASTFGSDDYGPISSPAKEASSQILGQGEQDQDTSSLRQSPLVDGKEDVSPVDFPVQPEQPGTRGSPPMLGVTSGVHINEAGAVMGSPEWTAKERHEREEPAIRDSPMALRATPVTHQNEAGVTVGSPERAAIERHQHEPEELIVKSPASSVKPTPTKSKADFETFMGSPEKTAKRRSQVKELEEGLGSDPSLKLARAAIASKVGHRQRGATPEPSRPQTRSKSFQKSPSPDIVDDSVQLAKASLNTPSKAGKAEPQVVASSPASSRVEEEASSLTASKLKLVRHLRDELSDCTTLKVLRQHTGQALEVMAVAMMTPPDPRRAKGGPREYMMSFTITDHSISPSSVVEAQLYRPHKESLPQVKMGDVVLLRSFTVVSLKGKGYGLRTNEGSSWAVFDKEDEPAQIKGPPVEYGVAETAFAAYLREWYGLLDEKAKQKLEKANQTMVEAGRAK